MTTDQSFLISFALLFYGLMFAQQEPLSNNSDKITEIVFDLSDEKGIDPTQIAKYNALKKRTILPT